MKTLLKRLFTTFLLTGFLLAKAFAQPDPDEHYVPYIIFAEDANKDAIEVDSLFYLNALPIVFPVSRTIVANDNPGLLNFIQYALPMLTDERLKGAHVRVRSAASPEGPLWFNQQLSRGRRDALLKIFNDYGVNPASIHIDVVDEEYELLAFFMRQAEDPDAALVSRMVREHIDDPVLLKKMLQEYDEGRLWERMLQEYYPNLRASRFMIILPNTYQAEFLNYYPLDLLAEPIIEIPIEEGEPWEPDTMDYSLPMLPPPYASVAPNGRVARRELLSVKTNLLEWGAWVPQYGMCPMPNIELEFYPKHGHWTVGGNFDCPWWIGNTTNHKYFELRNYTVYTRYYLRNSNRSYSDPEHTIPTPGKAAFRGFYLSAYAHGFLYQIGLSATKGWIGEGVGGGLGLGYVLPISKSGHWRLDFGLQVGMFYTPYDPFVWGKPTYHGGQIDGLYYYDTPFFSDNFKKRMHRYTWFGPTRVGISISYDLLYRRKDSKKPSFRAWDPKPKEGGEE